MYRLEDERHMWGSYGLELAAAWTVRRSMDDQSKAFATSNWAGGMRFADRIPYGPKDSRLAPAYH